MPHVGHLPRIENALVKFVSVIIWSWIFRVFKCLHKVRSAIPVVYLRIELTNSYRMTVKTQLYLCNIQGMYKRLSQLHVSASSN